MNDNTKKTDSIPAARVANLNKDLESWVVNSLKVKMIKKLDGLLENDGRDNVRKLFLVPVFTISELKKRVEETAPEIKTFFYRELFETVEEAGKKIV